jgi:1-acyl-sn-glycerol-3-phosphate acyltransferase
MLYNGIEFLCKFFFRFQIGTIQGIDNLPPPPCIIAANHVSPYDPMLLVVMLYSWLKKYNKKLMFLTNRKFIVIFAAFPKSFGMFRGTKRGLNEALDYLHKGIPIGIFPNRDRKPNQIKKFHLGPAYLAAKAKVPIVPIGITTREEVNPSWSLIKIIKSYFYKKNLFIGKPIFVNNRSLYKTTEELTEVVGNLINKEITKHHKL